MILIESLQAKNNALIFSVIDLEWPMFSSVQGLYGPAPCQDQRQTFTLMRYSQHACFTEEFLVSYRNDLNRAEQEGRNLFTERYAHMMEKTDPAYYATELAPHLPKMSPAQALAIEEALKVLAQWDDEMRKDFSSLSSKARPSQDQNGSVSSLSYIEGEMKSYSLKTLLLFLKNILALQQQGRNLVEEIVFISQYFYSREEEFSKLDPRAS